MGTIARGSAWGDTKCGSRALNKLPERAPTRQRVKRQSNDSLGRRGDFLGAIIWGRCWVEGAFLSKKSGLSMVGCWGQLKEKQSFPPSRISLEPCPSSRPSRQWLRVSFGQKGCRAGQQTSRLFKMKLKTTLALTAATSAQVGF